MDKKKLTVTARKNIPAQDTALPAGWIGRWSGYEITFNDGTVLTVSSGIRGTAEIVNSTEDGDTLTVWIR